MKKKANFEASLLLGVLTVLWFVLAGGPASGQGEKRPVFKEVARESGVRFQHRMDMTPEKFMIETMGSGVCFLDFDKDGDQDLYFVQSGPNPGTAGKAVGNVLYQNDGKGHFSDVTGSARVGDQGYGMGCTVADYDNDGDVDLYVTNFGPNVLYQNQGDGTFVEVAKKAGVDNSLWGASAAFADYDQDGHLDLYVTNYVLFAMDDNRWCGDHHRKIRAYCHPDVYDGAPDALYRNKGDGTFEEVSEKSGITARAEKGLGVVWSDLDDDGDVDLYVANDSVPNILYRNNGNGTFTDVTLASSTGYNEDGKPEAGMGTDVGDADGDGLFDIIVTNLSSETNQYYRNVGDLRFEVDTYPSGFGQASLPFVGFGLKFFEYDNDGDLDIYVANGHIIDNIKVINDSFSYAQRDMLFENQGGGRFKEVGRSRGEYFKEEFVGRGMAVADIDGDGDLDVAVSNSNQRAVLLRNDGGNDRHFLRIRLVGKRSNRDGVGAKVTVTTGDKRQVRMVRSGSSFCSQDELVLHFGLGNATAVEKVEIRWPAGGTQVLTKVPGDQLLVVEEKAGAPSK